MDRKIALITIAVIAVAAAAVFLFSYNEGSSSNGGLEGKSGTYEINGRQYLLHIPMSYDNDKSFPLLLVFHGNGGDPAAVAEHTGFGPIADREGFIVAYPDSSYIRGEKKWDWTNRDVKDLDFVESVITDVKDKFSIDSSKIFAAGMSAGGVFAMSVGCGVADIDGIAPVSGSIDASNLEAYCERDKPLPFIGFYGTEDPLGEQDKFEGAVEFWGQLNGCKAEKVSEELGDKDPSDGTTVTKISGSSCEADTVYYRINGGGHRWPGAEYEGAQGSGEAGATSMDISASELIWEFFSQL